MSVVRCAGFKTGLMLLTLLAAALLPSACFGAQTANTVWIEGETAASTYFFPGRTIQIFEDGSGASGGECLKLWMGTAWELPFYAEYDFTIKTEGDYSLWLAATPQNQGWASPMSYKLDGGAMINLAGKEPMSRIYGEPPSKNGILCWTLADTVRLKPGKHNLRFEVRTKCNSDRYNAMIDVIVLTTDTSFAPQGNHPSLSPWPTWEETMKGTNFEDYKKKLSDKLYYELLAKTEEDVSPATREEVIRKLMARPLPKPDPNDNSIHRFGIHSMMGLDLTSGNKTDLVKRAYELMARAGVDSLRTNSSCWHCSGLEPKDFKRLRAEAGEASKYGMNFMFTTGYPTGKWAVVDHWISTWRPEFEPQYRQYLHTLFTEFGNVCQYSEYGNEVDVPEVWWKGATPEMYVRDVRILKEELAKTSSKARIVGFAATGSRDLKLAPGTGRDFVDKCFQAGIQKYADAYSVHYTWEMADRDMVDFFRREMAKYGGGMKPIINSEEGSSKLYDIAKLFARNLFMYDMESVYDFLAQDYYENGGLNHLGLFDKYWTPKLRLLSFAASVDAMKHRKLVGMAAPEEGVEAYVLEYEDGYKGTGPAYSIVMWRNDNKSIGTKRDVERATKVQPCKVLVAGVVSANDWRLDPVKVNEEGSISVGTPPVFVYTNRLPKWKLISGKEWLDNFEDMMRSRQASTQKDGG